MFILTDKAIDAASMRTRLQDPRHGALVVFEGWVRNHHKGRRVTRLEYEAFAELAQSEGGAIIETIEQTYPGVSVVCVHRHGDLRPGDMAVWVGAASAHRDDAFRAAREVIEEIKRRLPVWKKEHHPGMQPVWVNCTEEAVEGTGPDRYNARQCALPEVGQEGQLRLTRARVLVVGLGGLGCPAALYLAGSGVGHLTLMDGDTVAYSNLHRQLLYEAGDVGAAKALRAMSALRARNRHIRVEAVTADLTAKNARAHLTGQAVVLDCSDNFDTRMLLHDACLEANIPLVQAAVHRWEGVLNVYQRGRGGCYYCLGPSRLPSGPDGMENCSGAPVFGPAVATLGLLQASQAIKLILGRTDEECGTSHTLLVDLLDTGISRIARPARSDCPHCGSLSQIAGVAQAAGKAEDSLMLEWAAIARLEWPRLVALATAAERAGDERLAKLEALSPADAAGIGNLVNGHDRPLVLVCPHGLRSTTVVRWLRARGAPEVYSLHGGSAALPPSSPSDLGQ